ncbi:CSN-associated deubiquitinating enzyme Ubp12 [Agyrium rufum]|nr:CSN-associated deubiquitinating enzyme Ubp12 [Agyrium rufum]
MRHFFIATTSSIIKKRKLSTKSDPKSPASSSLKSPIPLAGKSFTRREGRSPTSLLPSKDASRALAGSSSQVTPNSPLSQSSTASDERLISTEKDTKGGGSETENVERAHPTEGIAGDRRVPTDAQAYDKTKSTKAGRSYAASLKAMDRPASPAKRPRSEIEEAPKDGKATNVEENGSDAPQQQSQGLADSIESQDDVNTSVQSSTRPQPNRHTRDLSVDMFAGEQESTSDQSTPQVLHPFKNSTSLAAGAYVSPQSAASSDTSTASTTSKTSAASDVSSEQREDVPSIDEQIEQVQSIVSGVPVSEGMKGYIISMSWLNRVKSRSSQKGSETFDKSTLVGPIGPVDNSNITLVLDASMAALKDETGEQYVPLRPGLQVSDDFEILPPSAWELIIKWYGLAKGSSVITRYCHNTSTSDTSDNLQFELYPLILTILKLPDRSGGLNLESMKEKNTKAVKLVASRSERFQNFLKRAKEEAGINLKTKVRMWMAMSPAQAQDFSEPGMLTPAHSRSSSPNPPPRIPPPIIDPNASLSLDLNDFAELQKKVQLEPIEIKDETANEKYNGHTDLGFYFLGQDSLLILEEQVGGPAGGEWVSNLSAKTKKGSTTGVPISITKNGTTKVQSRNHSTSGRSSPAPNTGMMTRGRAKKNGKIIGTVGLTNLGNTCYMNSALQCVRSVHELTEYFLQGLYKSDLNPRNPLAHNGDVAKSYAALLRELYSDSSYGAFAPRAFKAIIGRYGPSFSGYGQQDSQEFLGFLLDGLQEDLNRIHSKPYIEKPDSTDEMVHNPQALREMADTCWDIYKKRNNSVITDLFAGMYKSTVVCPVCDKVSIIFDPFNTLTLQLPIENLWSRSFVYFPICAPPVQISVDIDKNATFSALKEMVGKKTGADAKRLMIAEVYKSKFFKTFEDRKSIAEERIQDADEICIYELEDVPTNYPVPTKKKTRSMINIADEDEDALDADSSMADKMLVPLFHRGETDSSTAAKPRRSFFAYPSFIIVTREEAQSQDAILQKALMNAMTMTTFDLFPSDGSSDEQVQPEEADTVIMNNDDLDSSSDSKINASSIQSEDGMVDVTVGGSTAKPAESQLPRISYPPNYPRSIQKRPLPQLLKSGEYIPAQYRELFDMKTYSGKSIIPIGWSSMADDGQYVPLEDRLPKRASAPKKTSVAHQAALRAMNQESPPSSDEDEPIEVPTMAAPISDDEDMSDGIPEIENPANAPSYSSNNGFNKAKRNGGNKQISRASTEDGERDSGDPVALLRLGDALVLDWRTSTFDTLFYENGPNGEENMRGSPTWNQAPQIADPELDEKRLTRSRRRKNGVSLEDCLDEFGKEEILSENDAWYCPRCKEHRRASKRFELWKAPDILIMHLKRFSAQGRFRDKLDVKVDFPVEGLDLSSRVVVHEEGKELVYDLFAVDNHYGGLGGGHYTAFAKNYNDDAWYEYNDSQVSRRSDPKYVVTSSAYLLFYRRRSTAPLGGPIFENFFAFEDEDEDEVAEETYDDLESVNTDDLDPLLLPKLGSENVSRAESPGPSGEGQRLDDRSCNGSLSASRGLGATRQTVTGAPEAGVAGGALAALASARAAPGAVGHQASSGNSREVDMGSGISELPAYSNVPAKPRIVRNYSLKDEQLKATWGFDLANSQEYDVTQDGDEDGAETMDWKDAGIIQSNNLDDMIPDAVSEDLFDGASTKALSSNGGSDMSGSPQRPFADVDFGGMTHEEYEQLEDEGYDFPPVPEDENLEDRQRYGTPVESGPSAAAAAAGTEVDVDTDAGSSPVQIRGGAGSLSTGKGKGKGTTGLTQQMQLAGLTGYASETDDEK